MSSPAALEVLLSLTLQVAVLYAATLAMERRAQGQTAKDCVWKAFYLLVLALSILAWFGPHLRIVPPQFPSGNSREENIWPWGQLLSQGVVWLWGVGVILGTMSLALGIVSSIRNLKLTIPCQPSLLAAFIPSEAEGFNWLDRVEVRTSSTATRPYCWQFSRPIVVLPSHLLESPAEIVRPIIRHEFAHLQLNHPLHLFLQRLVEILFWFHPVVFLAARSANLQRELLADNHSVTSREEAVQYLKGLLLLAERIDTSPALPVGLAFVDRGTDIPERVKRIVERTWEYDRPTRELRKLSCQIIVAFACLAIWIPFNPSSSSRSMWSPWPEWSATALHVFGVSVRDYEIDSHRLVQHHTHNNSTN